MLICISYRFLLHLKMYVYINNNFLYINIVSSKYKEFGWYLDQLLNNAPKYSRDDTVK